MKLYKSVTFALVCAATAVQAAEPSVAADSLAGKPNIVVILSDDQAWADYGFMGHEVIETPALV